MNQSIGYFNGLRIVETNAITKQIQRRAHKKRRINKKWLKMYGHKTVPDNAQIIIYGDCIYATPKTAKKLIETVKGGAE